MLLHVVDASSDMRQEQIEQVNQVLEEIDAQKAPQLFVLNKIDLAGLEPGIDRNEEGRIRRVSVSAVTGAGLDLLRHAIAEFAADNGKVQKEGVEVKGTVPDPRWDATAS